MALIIKSGEIPVDCLGCDEMVMLSQCPIHINEPLKYCDGTRHPGCPILGEIPDKHGDFVDVQAIEERAKEIQYERGITYKEALLIAFDEASVVVEATE